MRSAFTIAVVDDDQPFVVRMAEAIRAHVHDAHVVAFESGVEFLRLAPALDPCIVLLDLILDRHSGLSVLAELRKLQPNISVIMMSQHRGMEPRHAARRLGAAGFEDRPRDQAETDALAACVARFKSLVERA